LAGVGKSTLANAIGKELKLPVLDKDDIGDVLFPIQNLESTNRHCYDVLWNIVRKQLEVGVDVIVDSPLRLKADFERVSDMVAKLGGSVRPIRVTCSDIALWRSRLEERNRYMPEHRKWSWRYHRERYENVLDAEPVSGECVVDASESIESNLRRCIDYIVGDSQS
jgi:predicted kinase